MSWFRLPKRPPTQPPVVAPPLTLALRTVPVIQPVPIISGDPLDISVIDAWTAFQRRTPNATWDAFIAFLQAASATLDADIAQATRSLADYPPGTHYRP